MLELRHLRQFVAVAEELHFGRAAARLHMTQPPLTMGIRQLESLLGAPLFHRTRRSVLLSPAGHALLPEARRLLAQAEQLGPMARAAAAGTLGRLRLGFVSTIGYGPLPGWLKTFRESHPGVELALREATLDVQLAAFEAGEIDAGFVLHAPGERLAGFGAVRVQGEPLVLALPGDHRLTAHPSLKAAQVLDEPLVIFPRAISPSLYDAMLAFYRDRQRAPRIAQEAIQMQTIVNLVSAGIGVAWVPETVTRLQRPGVVYRTVEDAGLACETSLVWRLPQPPVVSRFVDHVMASVPSFEKEKL
ncbi:MULTISPECIES: LysR family transcriptional regulator [Caldimonas]|uniref:LysR family transcriptional regulator n=1 Tax=Caldimonas TaxID=196013 RepID=UPI00037AD364|nr:MULTISPECIES: LysR family transcriptional regulator [Caldimonas]MCX7660070.1 LysR family transcriptional regulator [Caldimonas manganoxidans]GIX23779.1 MAG: isoleucine biosynthesis transcriptional activator [Caldimonas sp.]